MIWTGSVPFPQIQTLTMRQLKTRFELTRGWVLATAKISPNGGVDFTFDRVESDSLFPGLAGTTVHFDSLRYREAHILPALNSKRRDRMVIFNALGVGLTVENGYEYAMLISVDPRRVIEIKSISLKVGFDSVIRHLSVEKDSKIYHVKFVTGQEATGTIDRITRMAILQVEGNPDEFLYHSDNNWFVKELDGEFHRILVLPKLHGVNGMFIRSVIKAGIGAIPAKAS